MPSAPTTTPWRLDDRLYFEAVPMPWNTSTRASRLPSDWAAIRRAVSARAGGLCEATRHVSRCDGIGTDADHIVAGDDHSLDNLQWLSGPCHDAKTALEAARRNRANAALKRRPQESHPGRKQHHGT